MPQKFIWSCTHQYTHPALRGRRVEFQFKCYMCSSFSKFCKIHEKAEAMLEAFEGETDRQYVNDEIKKSFYWEEKQLEKTLYEYGKESAAMYGDLIVEVLKGLTHEEMLNSLADEDGRKLLEKS